MVRGQEEREQPSSRWMIAALLLFYVPTFYDLAIHHWASEDQIYSPLVALAVLYLFWSLRHVLQRQVILPKPLIGFTALLLGLMAYVIGRSQGVMVMEAGSMLPVIAGVVLALRGSAWFRTLWFPIFYLVFLIPLPNMFVDAITGPLKIMASNIAESLLYAFDYPIARSGVTLTIGKYQLLVADACSGLRSIFSLFALGLIYLHLLHRRGLLHNTLLIMSIVPIALIANSVRVLLLVLIIYHYGEQVGLGAIHGLSGLIIFVLALLIFLGFDSLLTRLLKPRRIVVPAIA
jgi:exosortase B